MFISSQNYFSIFLCIVICLTQVTEFVEARGAENYMKFTSAEKMGLRQIRKIMGKELYIDLLKSNGMLIHVLRARNGNVDRAVEMLRNIIKWRQENKIDQILFEDFSNIKKQYPYWLDGGARNGGPIATVPIWDIRKITVGGHLPQVMRYIDRVFEEGILETLAASEELGREVTQGVVIVDLNGYSTRTHACLACLPFYYNFITHYENYYPQSASDIFLINTPRIFDSLLQTIRPLMSEATKRDLQIFGVDKDEWRAAILKVVPIERLRKHLGGKLE